VRSDTYFPLEVSLACEWLIWRVLFFRSMYSSSVCGVANPRSLWRRHMAIKIRRAKVPRRRHKLCLVSSLPGHRILLYCTKVDQASRCLSKAGGYGFVVLTLLTSAWLLLLLHKHIEELLDAFTLTVPLVSTILAGITFPIRVSHVHRSCSAAPIFRQFSARSTGNRSAPVLTVLFIRIIFLGDRYRI